jgi:hypothetical protein
LVYLFRDSANLQESTRQNPQDRNNRKEKGPVAAVQGRFPVLWYLFQSESYVFAVNMIFVGEGRAALSKYFTDSGRCRRTPRKGICPSAPEKLRLPRMAATPHYM